MAKVCTECGAKHYAKGKCKIHYKMPSQLNPKSINKVSKKMSDNLIVYRKLRDSYLSMNGVCEFKGCVNANVELHHKKTREYFLCDVSVFMAVCSEHHRYIHENDKEARDLGYLLNSI